MPTKITDPIILSLGAPSIQKYIDPFPDTSYFNEKQKRDYEHNRFAFIGIKITVFVYSSIGNLHDEIVSSLWGIEDYCDKNSDEYFDNEIIPDLKSEIRNSLKAVYNFPDDEIDRCFNNATKHPGDVSW